MSLLANSTVGEERAQERRAPLTVNVDGLTLARTPDQGEAV